jgi:hypothetical protein
MYDLCLVGHTHQCTIHQMDAPYYSVVDETQLELIFVDEPQLS